MKILICSNAYPPNFIGGAELIAHYQARALQEMGHEILVFTGDPQAGAERHQVTRDTYDGLGIIRIRLTHEDYSYNFVNFFHADIDEQFQKVLDSFSPDIVHFHNIIGLSLGMIHRAKVKGAKTVLTVHDHWGFCCKNTLMKQGNEICSDFSRCSECIPFMHGDDSALIPGRIRKGFFLLMLNEIDTFISPSQYLADQYLRAGIGKGKFSVIWYGIDVARFARVVRIPCKNKVRFTFVGYFGRHKGVHILLKALSFLSDRSKVLVNLVGEGEELNEYRRLVGESGWTESVHFWGKVDNKRIEEVYRNTDVFILPSIWPENQPVTITEAMSAEIPVIGSQMGGISELIDDGVNGFLFRAGDAMDLAQKMSYFLSNPEKIASFGKAARRKMADNSLATQASKILAEYRKQSSLPMHEPTPSLVVCIGEKIDADCLSTLNGTWLGEDNILFLLHGWLEQDHLKESVLLWIVDKKTSFNDISPMFNLNIPFLVPSDNYELKTICRKANCGLYYVDAYEAEACIKYLVSNRSEARAIGDNCRHALRSTSRT